MVVEEQSQRQTADQMSAGFVRVILGLQHQDLRWVWLFCFVAERVKS